MSNPNKTPRNLALAVVLFKAADVAADTIKQESYNYCADLFNAQKIQYSEGLAEQLITRLQAEIKVHAEKIATDIEHSVTSAFNVAEQGDKAAAEVTINGLRERMVTLGRSIGEVVAFSMLEELKGLPPAPQLQ